MMDSESKLLFCNWWTAKVHIRREPMVSVIMGNICSSNYLSPVRRHAMAIT